MSVNAQRRRSSTKAVRAADEASSSTAPPAEHRPFNPPTAPDPYTGPDRRHRVTDADSQPYLTRTAITVAAVMSVWALLAGLAAARSDEAATALVSTTHSLCGALFLGAAALMFATWRITGTARAAWSVVALALVGFAFPVVGIIGSVTSAVPHDSATAAMVRALIKLAVIAVGIAALRTPDVRARLRPMRVLAPFLVATAAVTAVALTTDIERLAAGPLTDVATGLRYAAAAGFAALSVAFARSGLRQLRGRPDSSARDGTTDPGRRGHEDLYIAGGLGLLALGALGRAIFLPLTPDRALVGAGLTLVLATAVASASAFVLWQLHTGRGTHLLAVTGELHGTRSDLAHLESDQARRLHDARNAIFAISGATELLAADERPAAIDPAHVKDLVIAELDRLGSLLDPGIRSRLTRFAAADLIEPIALTYRTQGARIDTTIDPRLDRRPLYCAREPIAGAIVNILTNARVHAPGAHIWVNATVDEPPVGNARGYDAVRIVIADDGPGIPSAEHAAVMLPGTRGTDVAAPGSGLGLASAAQAMSEAHGTLRLSDRKGGGTMVELVFPADQRGTEVTG